MSNYAVVYLDRVIGLLERIKNEEQERIDEAARLLADTVEEGNCIFAFGCTHSSLPVQDLVYRAGGFMLVNPLFGPGIASLDIKPTTLSSAIEKLPGYAGVLLDESPLKQGDALIIVSVSGRNAVPVELAQMARERKIKVIGVTSVEYSGGVSSRHSSGKKMHDFADVLLDNKAPIGDAVLEDPIIPQKFCPVSGVTSTAVLQALMASTIEELLKRGLTPPVFLAANVDGGAEYNARLLSEYRDRIYYL